jgi:hypothetical protein
VRLSKFLSFTTREGLAAARSIGLRSISFLAADLDSTAFDRPLAWLDRGS